MASLKLLVGSQFSGGLRATQELRQLVGNLNMMAIPQTVPVPFFSKFINDEKYLCRSNRSPTASNLRSMSLRSGARR